MIQGGLRPPPPSRHRRPQLCVRGQACPPLDVVSGDGRRLQWCKSELFVCPHPTTFRHDVVSFTGGKHTVKDVVFIRAHPHCTDRPDVHIFALQVLSSCCIFFSSYWGFFCKEDPQNWKCLYIIYLLIVIFEMFSTGAPSGGRQTVAHPPEHIPRAVFSVPEQSRAVLTCGRSSRLFPPEMACCTYRTGDPQNR